MPDHIQLSHGICSETAAAKKGRTVYMVQSWNKTVYMVQKWNKEEKKQDDEGWILHLLSNTREKKQDNERWILYILSEKEEQYPTEKVELIDYHQDEERNDNVDDYPSVHTTLQQSSGD